MARFFSRHILNDIIEITGSDAKHICKVLRMSVGESLVVCDLAGYDYDCKIKSVSVDKVVLKIEKKRMSDTEPKIKLRLFQGFPKGDKFDFIVQKSVELGASEIVPVMMNRCVPVLDEKNKKKKQERYNKIAFEAAKQCNRSKLPVVGNFISFVEAINQMKNMQSNNNIVSLLFYEKSENFLKNTLKNIFENNFKNDWKTGSKSFSEPEEEKTINLMIGPEGGFDESEIEIAKLSKIHVVSMGKRILRCETAPIFALSSLIYEFEQ